MRSIAVISCCAALLAGTILGNFGLESGASALDVAAAHDGVTGRGNDTPIENELNRALRKSLNRAQRRSIRPSFVEGQSSRVSVTHNLSARVDSEEGRARSKVFEQLREELYARIGDECEILSKAFGKICHMTNLSVRPVVNTRIPTDEVRLTATATYVLKGVLDD